MYWKMFSHQKAKFDTKRKKMRKKADLRICTNICKKDFCTENYLLPRAYYRQITNRHKWQPSHIWCDWLSHMNIENNPFTFTVVQPNSYTWIPGIFTHTKKHHKYCKVILFSERLSQWLFSMEFLGLLIKRRQFGLVTGTQSPQCSCRMNVVDI